MKKLALAAASLIVATTAFAATIKETVDRTLDVKPGSSVVLTNVNGGITITSWDQPKVRVVAQKTVEGDRKEAQQAMKELRVDIQPRNGGVVIETHYPEEMHGIASIFDWITGDDVDAHVKYELTVPRSMNLDISNTNGSIRITDVAGKHDLDTTNGRIEATRCGGAIDATTTNGGIVAELVKVAPGQSMRLSTTNGPIKLAVPANFAGEVDAATTNGAIKTELPVTTTRTGDNRLRGTINGGGTLLKLRTTNGRIEIKKAL